MGKIFWVDCETTGLCSIDNVIIQIAGLIEVDEKVEEKVNLLMRTLLGNEKTKYREAPGVDDEVDDRALKVNGWTR